MKTFSDFAHNVNVTSFADIRATLSSYSVPSTLANTLKVLYRTTAIKIHLTQAYNHPA